MAVLVDSSLFIDVERRGDRLEELLSRTGDEPVAISAVTASELLHGVHRAGTAQRRAHREQFVEAVLASVLVYPFDVAVARSHARIWADLAASDRKIGAHDMIIAATAIAHGLPLITTNVDEFGRIEGLELLSAP